MGWHSYEVGLCYTKRSRYFIAVTEKALARINNGVVEVVEPYSRYEPCRSVSVAKLALLWCTTVAEIDRLVVPLISDCLEPRASLGLISRHHRAGHRRTFLLWKIYNFAYRGLGLLGAEHLLSRWTQDGEHSRGRIRRGGFFTTFEDRMREIVMARRRMLGALRRSRREREEAKARAATKPLPRPRRDTEPRPW